jgi:hypothetical protein
MGRERGVQREAADTEPEARRQSYAGPSRVTKNRAEAVLPNSISPAAERQRRRRERRRRGAIVVQIVISPATISNLVRLGWLCERDLSDRQAVGDAFIQFARWALAHV